MFVAIKKPNICTIYALCIIIYNIPYTVYTYCSIFKRHNLLFYCFRIIHYIRIAFSSEFVHVFKYKYYIIFWFPALGGHLNNTVRRPSVVPVPIVHLLARTHTHTTSPTGDRTRGLHVVQILCV